MPHATPGPQRRHARIRQNGAFCTGWCRDPAALLDEFCAAAAAVPEQARKRSARAAATLPGAVA